MLAASIRHDYNDTAVLLFLTYLPNQPTPSLNKEHPISRLASVRLVIASQLPMRGTKEEKERGNGKGQSKGILKTQDFSYAYDNPSQGSVDVVIHTGVGYDTIVYGSFKKIPS